MIRINLLPSSKKRIAAAKAAAGPGNAGPIWVLGWFIGWLALKLVEKARGKRRISVSDQRWLDDG